MECSDEELLSSVRSGNREAYAELWQRHHYAGIGMARTISPTADPEDLVAEAFLRIFSLLEAGKGPRAGFRPYLYQTVRNLATNSGRRRSAISIDECDQLPGSDDTEQSVNTQFDLQAIREAYKSLPERWQSVLWYSEVEGLRPREYAALLGLSPKAASQLARRARDGLRTNWLEKHLSSARADSECLEVVRQLIPYQEGGLAEKAHRLVEQHLSDCSACDEVAADSRLVLRVPGLLIGALVLGPGLAELLFPSAPTLAANGLNAESIPSAIDPAQPRSAPSASSSAPVAIASGLTALLVAATVAGVLVISPSDVGPIPQAEAAPVSKNITQPRSAERTADRETEDEKPGDHGTGDSEATPSVSLPSDPRASPRQNLSEYPPTNPPVDRPAAPPTPPPVDQPTLATLPIPSMSAGSPMQGRLSLTGAGAEAGASIEVRATTLLGEQSVVTVVAQQNGTWSLPRMSGVTPVGVTLDVRQLIPDDVDRQPSEWRRVITNATFMMWIDQLEATPTDAGGQWLLGGWPGAAWQLQPTAPGDPALNGVFGSNGFALIPVPEGLSSGGHAWSYGYVSARGFTQHSGALTATVS